MLLPILGTSWVFGVLAVSDRALVFQYMFAILNSLQVRKACRPVGMGQGRHGTLSAPIIPAGFEHQGLVKRESGALCLEVGEVIRLFVLPQMESSGNSPSPSLGMLTSGSRSHQTCLLPYSELWPPGFCDGGTLCPCAVLMLSLPFLPRASSSFSFTVS